MKKKFYIILFSLFAISLITGCGGYPKYDATREKKLKKVEGTQKSPIVYSAARHHRQWKKKL